MENKILLTCPVCQLPLEKQEKSYLCKNRHCFDEAKEGYVNLLTGKHKSGSLIGDNRDMALSRRSFLQKGYFSALSDELAVLREKYAPYENAVLCDICCGEGYYSDTLLKRKKCTMLCFDISREMVRLAAKRKNGATVFVASNSKIPLESKSVDFAFHLFAPFHEKEFSRITKEGGVIITAVAGENHLFELKELLYDTPYKNDENPPQTENLHLIEKRKVSRQIHIDKKEDIDALFKMTPYYYHTSDKDKLKLKNIGSLTVTTEFVLYIYKTCIDKAF